MKMLAIVAVGVVGESRKFSGHPYVGRIARSSFLVFMFTAELRCLQTTFTDCYKLIDLYTHAAHSHLTWEYLNPFRTLPRYFCRHTDRQTDRPLWKHDFGQLTYTILTCTAFGFAKNWLCICCKYSQKWKFICLYVYTVSPKNETAYFCHILTNYWPIFNILSMANSAKNAVIWSLR